MSPFSVPVLGAATVLASSALWQALVDETLSLEVALTRFVIAAAIAWMALSALGALVGTPMATGGSADGSAPSAGAAGAAGAGGDAGAGGARASYDAGGVPGVVPPGQ